jgi:hypothetical protein
MPNKYGQYERNYALRGGIKREVHPIWRGIGLIMMFLIPALSYLATLSLLAQNKIEHWVAIPREFILSGVADPQILIKIGMTILLSLVLYAVMTFIGLLIWRLIGPPRYGPMDAPPE